MNSVLQEFNKTSMLFDKTTKDATVLPYELEEVRVKTNTFLSVHSLNTILKKLYFNFLFLYKNSTIGDFRVFETQDFSISAFSHYPYVKEVKFTESFLDTNSSLFLNSSGAVLVTDNKLKDFRYLITYSDNKLVGLQLKRDSVEFVFNTTLIDTVSGSINFLEISDIKCYDNKNLFVVDSAYNIIVKYDISTFISNENIYQRKPIVKKVVGGVGTLEDRNKFASIRKITSNNNLLVAYDEGNKCFKIFDTNLNWLNTIVISKFFTGVVDKIIDIILLENNDIICCDINNLYYFIYDNNSYTLSKTYNKEKFFRSGEYITKLNLCFFNKNIVYVVTNKSIKKLWVTQLDDFIGEYYIEENNSNIVWMCNSRYSDNEDSIVLYSKKNNNKQLFNVYKDSLFLNSLLNNLDFEIYNEQDIILNQEEYIQSWVLVKAFKKIQYNNFIVGKEVKFKFLEDKNKEYDSIIDKIYNNSIVNFSNDFDFDDNFNIGINEIFQAEVINRIIANTINFQKILLRFVINNKSEKIFLSPNPFRGDDALKSYYYFVDESLLLDPNPVILQVFEELSPGPGLSTSLGGAPYSSLDDISIVEGVFT